ncbi:hypothetical protein CNMCM8980_007615 [Aspergillus fumigatiaffinis]|jgi:cell division protein FtsB|nr:hypothetical protein CNMCM5878_004556 [Aspergillus fumigatiaffinis]KAF4235127.1 hypothetical protein CNMCM6457_003424 [Aspergillus fumigatiaffinis]KAF4251328.1 hypothetical protein CNMCM8980_007615 [Aspergillus fumigatiaffinis]
MASLQEALQCLSPTTWDSFPTDPAKLRDYINDISSKARLIVDSVPESVPSRKQAHYTFDSSSPAASRIKPSQARTGSTDPKLASLQREWGKPLKVAGSKDNPLEIPIYKVQGADGKGHWFGRRSVHEGLPFSTWKRKLASEIDETLEANQVRIRKGRVADQAVRGIGAERLIERVKVKDEQGERDLGTVNVYHVSAQFPKPTTPRDFVTLIINWETEVNGGSEGTGAGAGAEAQRRGRNWMMVSKPCEHPDAPPRQGYIRGQYESVEFIREIPVNKPPVQHVPLEKAVSPAKSEDNLLRQGTPADPAVQKEATGGKVGRPRGKTESAVLEKRDETAKHIDDLDRDDEEDPWPVEWIMVTRSDPGGNIPRWMVEKGTPKSICTDAVKFVDWACRDTTTRDKDERDNHGRESSEKTVNSPSLDGDEESTDSDDLEYEEEEHHGLIASFAYLLNAGLERYAPKAVLDYLPHSPHRTRESSAQYSSSDDTDEPSEKETPSNVGAANAKGGTEGLEKDASTNAADAASQTSQPVPTTNSVPTTPLSELAHDSISPVDVIKMNKKGKLSSHEKQLAKLAQRKREVEAQLETIRNEIQSLQLGSSPEVDTKKARAAAATADSGASDQASSSAASTDLKPGAVEGASSSSNSHHKHKTNIESAHMHKVASSLFQQESKLLKQLGKIEKHQLKEASKIEAQQRKNADREEKTRSRSETDALRREVDTLKKEVERLRSERQKWLDLIASLQAENTRLVARQGGIGEGQ